MSNAKDVAVALTRAGVRDVLAAAVGGTAVGAAWVTAHVDSKWIGFTATVPLIILLVWTLVAGTEQRRREKSIRDAIDASVKARLAEHDARVREEWTPEVARSHILLFVQDAWCAVAATSSSWALHAWIRAYSAVPPRLAPKVTITLAEARLGENTVPIASVDPKCGWALRLGESEVVQISWPLTQEAATLIRNASNHEIHLSLYISLEIEGHPPTNPNGGRRALVHMLRVLK